MTTIELPTLADQVRALPPGAERDRQIYRFVDSYAARRAAAALKAAASRAPQGVLAASLSAASVVIAGTADDTARDRLRDVVASAEFIALVPRWIRELREVASARPESGACTIATALKLWSWTLKQLRGASEQAIDELADVVAPLIAARCLALDAVPQHGRSAKPADDDRADLSHVYSAHVAALAGAACAELVFGYRQHPLWDAAGCASCYQSDDLDALEGFIPGIASGARTGIDVIESDGSHPLKAGPCAGFEGLDTFMRLRRRLDACLTGARVAKERTAAAIVRSIASEGRA